MSGRASADALCAESKTGFEVEQLATEADAKKQSKCDGATRGNMDAQAPFVNCCAFGKEFWRDALAAILVADCPAKRHTRPVPPSKQSLAAGGKWTAVGRSPHRHFEIVSVGRDDVELRCVVTDMRRTVSRMNLLNPDAWLPGWRRIATDSASTHSARGSSEAVASRNAEVEQDSESELEICGGLGEKA